MNLVIIGVGKVGENLIANFINEKHNIFVVDIDSKRVQDMVNKYDVNGITGGGLERDILLSSGVDKADFVIACTAQDEKNILCCALAKKLGAKYTIARVREPELFKQIDNMKAVFGLDFIFNPELQTAKEISQILKYPSAISVETFCNGKATMLEFKITKDSSLVNKQIIQISKENGKDFLFGIVERDGKAYIPHGDFVLKENDNVYLISSESAINNITKKLQIFKRSAKSVFILGGSKIAYYLAKELLSFNVDVKIVEKDSERANILSKLLKEATILNFDASMQEYLQEEKLKDADACIILTGMDEQNIILSLYAKENGVNKVITKIDRPAILKMINKFPLDSIVSPKNIIANHIVRFVRTHQAYAGKGINTLYKLHDIAEALEFEVDETFNSVDVLIKDLHLKNNVLIGGIVRDDEFILPTGTTSLKIGDKVIIFTSEKQILDLNGIIK